MLATWIIQSNKISTAHSLAVLNAARQIGDPVLDAAVDTATGLMTEVPDHLNLIPYGSTHLTKIAYDQKWKHLFFNDDFRVEAWNSNRKDMLNGYAVVLTLADVKLLMRSLRKKSRWFIRPVKDLKEFSGFVDTSERLIEWVERLEGVWSSGVACDLQWDCLCAVSEAKEIQMEWRHLVVDGKVVTSSSYRWKGQPHLKLELDTAVLSEAQKRADDWLPHKCCCMDLALVNNNLYVLEFNCLNSTGFYDHDALALVSAVSRYVNQDEAEHGS